jgi:hypothetical protein
MFPRSLASLGLACLPLASCVSVTGGLASVDPAVRSEPVFDASPFVPAGFEVLRVVQGDLNGDLLEDAVVVATPDTTDPNRRFTRRVISIATARPDGGFELAARNESLASCEVCGGAIGDGLSDVSITNGELVVVNEGGIRARWSDVYKFRFDASSSDWLLVRYSGHVSSQMDHQSRRVELKAEDVGTKRFAELQPEDLPRPTIN